MNCLERNLMRIFRRWKKNIYIINHLRILGITFMNENLINKDFRYVNYGWQLEFIVIYESKDLPSIYLAILFRKLLEYEISLKKTS